MPVTVSRVRAVIAFVMVGLLAGGSCGASAEPTDGQEATVVYVIDGDTFDVEMPGGEVERIRPPQIDAPELDECGYDVATLALERLILGETIVLTPTADGPDRDSYGRLLRSVKLDGQDIGEVMVRAGMARWYSRYADEDRDLAHRYAAAEHEASDSAAGLWFACGWPN